MGSVSGAESEMRAERPREPGLEDALPVPSVAASKKDRPSPGGITLECAKGGGTGRDDRESREREQENLLQLLIN